MPSLKLKGQGLVLKSKTVLLSQLSKPSFFWFDLKNITFEKFLSLMNGFTTSSSGLNCLKDYMCFCTVFNVNGSQQVVTKCYFLESMRYGLSKTVSTVFIGRLVQILSENVTNWIINWRKKQKTSVVLVIFCYLWNWIFKFYLKQIE